MCIVCRGSVKASGRSRIAAKKAGHPEQAEKLGMELNAYHLASSGPSTYTKV